MGAAARRIDAPQRRERHLRVVPKPARRAKVGASSRARARASEARVRGVFNVAMVLVVALTFIGLVRVAVLAQAAEMTLTEGKLTKAIKAQRIETDQLEIDRSSLATPSRIEEIAGATMELGRPKSVRYITMSDVTGEPVADAGTEDPATTARAAAVSGAERVAAVIGTLVEMSAGEAQSLLVGDVGLAGSR